MKILILSIVLVLTFYLPQKAQAQVNAQDSLALIALYNSTDGANWNNPWNISQPVSTWIGVTIDSSGRVTRLYLSYRNLVGIVPSEIGNFTELTHLSIMGNTGLTGTIPSEIGNLLNLFAIDFSYNPNLTGTIPIEIGNLINLHYLRIDNCSLSGTIPDIICNIPNLQTLSFFNNQLSGSLPDSIGKLVNLSSLMIGYNDINGVPTSISSLINLSELSLSSNPIDSLPANMFDNFVNLGSMLLWIDGCGIKEIPYIPPGSYNAIKISRNKLTFEDIEPLLAYNYNYFDFTYYPQDSVLNAIDTTIHAGDTLVLSSLVGGQYNYYLWKRNIFNIAYGTNPCYVIQNANINHSGTYYCVITNTLATDLTLYRRPVKVTVDTSTSNSENKYSEKDIIYYNAENNTIYFNHTGNINEIVISDLYGRTIYKYNGNSRPAYYVLPEWNAYIVKVTTLNGVFTKKIF